MFPADLWALINLIYLGIVPEHNEASTQGPAQAPHGQIPRRGRTGLRRGGQGVAPPPLAADAEPLLRALLLLPRGQLHPPHQSRQQRQSG